MKKTLEYLMLAGTTAATAAAIAVNSLVVYGNYLHNTRPEYAKLLSDYLQIPPGEGLGLIGAGPMASWIALGLGMKYYAMRKKNEKI